MTTSARPSTDVVIRETGEFVSSQFTMADYLAQLRASTALTAQKDLAAAYDAACLSLIGPNDQQQEKGRSFKKKSAWRKLARYFGLSVAIVRVEREVLSNGQFLATVVARARAPWGQDFEEVGSCCTDEAVGRRVITIADAIATASTRASNRAISNLIAMGEMSAEEVRKGESHEEEEHAPIPDPEPTSATPWPADDTLKGKTLKEFPLKALLWLCEPGRKGPHIEIWQALAKDEIHRREATPAGAAQ